MPEKKKKKEEEIIEKPKPIRPKETFKAGGVQLTKEEFDVVRGGAGKVTERVREAEAAILKTRAEQTPQLLTGAQQQQVQEARVEEAVPELAQQFGEAGVFQTPQLKPIISPEMENAGVLLDMLTALTGVRPGAKGILEVATGKPPKGKEAFLKAQERATEAELALQNSLVNKEFESEIGKEFDKQIEQEVVQMGIGVGVAVGAVVGGFVGSFAQLIGTDKKVKNLTTGIVKLETIASDIASKVSTGDLGVDEGLRRIETISLILDTMEAQLQLAAIESANVRISLKGRDVAIKIFSGRSRINTSLNQIAGARVAGLIQDSPAVQKAAVLARLKQEFEAGES